MLKETPRTTVNRFSQNWDQTELQSLVAEFISISRETNREPDNYHFLVRNRKLIDPNTNKPVLDFIAEGTEKNVAKKLEDWAGKTEEGMALWISPSKEDVYPCPKIIIHQIAYNESGQKVVLNSAIIFDGNIFNPEFKRETLYSFADSDRNLGKILNWIKRKSKTNVINTTNKTTSEKALFYAQLINSGYSKQFVIQEMINNGFIGKNPISCPRGEVFTQNSYTSLVFGNSQILNFSSEKKGWSYSPGHCRICDQDRKRVGPCKICDECEKNF